MTQSGAQSAPKKKACVACGQEYDGSASLCPQDGTVLTPLVGDVVENLIGKVFADKYEILEQIGTGGMGKVYKARHLLMKRIVAIKVLLRELVSEATTLQRFQQEAEAASSLNHPHILTIFDFGISQEALPYIVMDYLEGKSLSAVMQESNYVDVDRATGIFVQICAGLAHAHSKGIVHRDLKPSNIMLITFDNQPDFVKIVDFGIAKLTAQSETEARNLTRTGQVFGSPLYMSPEQCRGGVLDARSDIYSMGCLMYKVLTGKHPIQGESLIDCLNKHCNTMPPGFIEVAPELNISQDVEAIIFKAMAKEPEARYQSMKELREALLQVYPAALSWTFSHSTRQSQTVLMPNVKGEPDTQPPVRPAFENTASNSGTRPPLAGTRPPISNATGAQARKENTSPSLPPAHLEKTNPTIPPVEQTAPVAKKAQPQIIFSILALVVSAVALGLAFMMYMNKKPNQPTPPDGADRAQLYEQFVKNGQVQYDRGNYFEAQNNVELALKQARKLGEDDPRTIAALNLLGKIYYSKEDYDNSRQTFEHILSMIDTHKQGKTAAVADALNGLGLVYSAQSKWVDATALLKRAMKIRENVSGSKSAEVSDSLVAMAELDMRRGKYKDAIGLLNNALDIRQETLGRDHPNVAVVLNDLGQSYQVQGKLSDAERLYKRSLNIRQSKLGPDNPATADCLILLGTLNFQKDKLSESEEMLERALSIKEKSLGSDSNALPQILRALTIVNVSTKDFDHAETYIKRALAINEKNLEPSDPEIQKTKRAYADLLNRTGRKKEARDLMSQ